jgi:Rap1a immunity proteins
MRSCSRNYWELILVTLSLCVVGTEAFAADTNSELQWFADLAKTNNGKAFCAPPTTTIKELVEAFSKVAKQHREWNGQVSDEQALRALAESYPCSNVGVPETRRSANEGVSQTIDGYRQKGTSIHWVAPIFSQLVSTSVPAGFQALPVYEATLPGPRYMRESVLEGENEKEWTQMITITGAKELSASANFTLQAFVERMAAGYKKACPDSFSGVSVPVGKISGYDTFSAIVSCGTSPMTQGRTSESAMILAIKGQRDYYTVQWAERSKASTAPLAIESAKWIQRFHSLSPIRVCAIIPGEAAPYPSCVD